MKYHLEKYISKLKARFGFNNRGTGPAKIKWTELAAEIAERGIFDLAPSWSPKFA